MPGEEGGVFTVPGSPERLMELARAALFGLYGEERLREICRLANRRARGERALLAVVLFEVAQEQLERKVRAELVGVPATTVAAVLTVRRKEWRTTGLEVCCTCLGPRRVGGQEVSGLYHCGSGVCVKVWRRLRPTTGSVRPYRSSKVRCPGLFENAKPGRCDWCRHAAHLDGPCPSHIGRGTCRCPRGQPAPVEPPPPAAPVVKRPPRKPAPAKVPVWTQVPVCQGCPHPPHPGEKCPHKRRRGLCACDKRAPAALPVVPIARGGTCAAGMFSRAKPGRCAWCRHAEHPDGACSQRQGRGACRCPAGQKQRAA